ncbi:hypothetical protein C9J19_19195 [Photobacterium phosphoreum]|uniref:DUF4123 domain-containing protein n=1 Tax=Photobacterium phosphoreum TaxID=659 RepID=UPI000D159A40|nr:DUF4123 domain-containing protein [Photobacterium phosphoreum]PSW25194.1 hypothetical protein C9J19_19195 [Photobacterium phosphoreum]
MFLANENHWIVIDTPQSQQSITYINIQELPYFWWYINTPLKDSLSVSPIWVLVPHNKVEDVLTRFPNSAVFSSNLNDGQFEDYIKSFTLMLSPTHKPYVVRFYNPKYLQHWLTKLSRERRNTLLGPITSISWQQDETIHSIKNNKAKIIENSKINTWFQLNETEWELLKIAYKK